MKGFLTAALPWVLLGVSLAIVLASFADEKKKGKENYGMPGMCLGLSTGLAVGISVHQMSMGMCIGMLLGLGIGRHITKENEEEES